MPPSFLLAEEPPVLEVGLLWLVVSVLPSQGDQTESMLAKLQEQLVQQG